MEATLRKWNQSEAGTQLNSGLTTNVLINLHDATVLADLLRPTPCALMSSGYVVSFQSM